jgi:hypothetical protein
LENAEVLEGWSLYKPIGAEYNIPVGPTGTSGDGDGDEGLMVSMYTGDVILRNYRFDSASSINQKFDSGDLHIGLQITESAASTETDPVFPLNDVILYNMSFLYDGYQEGPLMSTPVTAGPIETVGGCDYLSIKCKTRTENPRVSHIQIYRKRLAAEKYRLVKSIPLDTEWESALPASSTGDTMTTSLEITIQDYGKAGISYEALTGMPETMRSTMVDYAESAKLGGYLFATNAVHDKLPDAKKMIFRSLPGKFSLFNWAADYCGMPEQIHSLVAHDNRLIAFSKGTMYIVDPFNLVVEHQYKGMGINHQRAALSAHGILYLATDDGLYRYAGNRFQKITATVDDKWREMYKHYPSASIKLALDKVYNSIIVFFDNAGSRSVDYAPTECLVYTIDKNRWDIWEMPAGIKSFTYNEKAELMVCAASSNVAGFVPDGRALDAANWLKYQTNLTDLVEDPLVDLEFMTNSNSLYSLHTKDEKKPLIWETKGLTLGEDVRDKKYKTIKFIGQDMYLQGITLDGTYSAFAESPADLTVETSGSGDQTFLKYKLPNKRFSTDDVQLDWTNIGKNMRLKFKTTATGTNPMLKNVAITYTKKTIK